MRGSQHTTGTTNRAKSTDNPMVRNIVFFSAYFNNRHIFQYPEQNFEADVFTNSVHPQIILATSRIFSMTSPTNKRRVSKYPGS